MIEQISLRGFKSFAGPVRLELSPGITAVLGPNGSGKSNVVDAVRWGCHLARARHLRALQGTDLIFHGSKDRAPLGMAEVAVELSGPPGRLRLARRIYRDGQAEQELNGRLARVSDVQSALHPYGLGPGSLAVVGQNEIAEVISAGPALLLRYVEEACALAGMGEQQAQAAEQLAQARGYLQDALRTLQAKRASLSELGLQAQLYQRQRVLQQRVAELDSGIAWQQWYAWLRELERLRAQEQELSQRIELLAAEDHRLEVELLATDEQLLPLAERARLADQLAAREEGAAQLERQAERHLATLERSLAAADAELAALPEPADSPRPQGPDLAARSALERQLAEVEAGLRALRAEQAGGRSQLLEAERARAAWESARSAREQREADLTAASAELERAAAQLASLEEASRQAERQLAAQEEELAAGTAQLAALDAELEKLSSLERAALERVSRLRADDQRAGQLAQGSKLLRRSALPWVVGLVADLLVVPQELEIAVLAALGRRLEQVVLRHSDGVEEALALLRRAGARATLLPLDLLALRPDPPKPLDLGVVGWAAERIRSDPPEVARYLLSRILIVEDQAAALAIRRRGATASRLVTLQGDLFEVGGAVTGGAPPGRGGGLLEARRLLREAEREHGALQRRREVLQSSRETLAGPLAPRQAELARRTAQLSALRSERERAAGQRQALELQVRRLGEQLGAPLPPAPPLPEIREVEAELAALERRWQSLRQQDAEERAASQRAGEQLLAWELAQQRRLRRERTLSERSALRVQVEAQRAELSSLSAERASLLAQLAQLGGAPAELARQEERRRSLQRRRSQLAGELGQLAAQRSAAALATARKEGQGISLPEGPRPPEAPGSVRSALAERAALQRELEGIGPVNALAEEQLDRLAGDLGATQRRCDEAGAVCQDLERVLGELSAQRQQRLQEGIARLAQAFSNYCSGLLGGQGEVVVADAGESAPGLSVRVSPAKGRWRSLALLSTGERTLAGLALLLALGDLGEAGGLGLPVAILDEVDAALDETNIRRLTGFLADLAARGSQVILVTHQKATMEVAQALIGVTTGPDGGSLIYTLKQL
jgi:chromosome segregation protein